MKIYLILIFSYLLSSFSVKSEETFWQKLDTFPGTWNVRCIAFNNIGYGYFACGGIFKTTDDGLSWELLGLKNVVIWNLVIDDKGFIFISNNDGHLLRSKDDGKTWDDLTSLIGWSVSSDFDCIFNERGHLLIGPYRTTDHGDTWTNEYNYLGGYYSYAMNSEGHIFRGGLKGPEAICRSTDDGDTWEVVLSLELDPNWVEFEKMLFNPQNTVGYANGYKTIDNGKSWNYRNKDIEPAGLPLTIDSIYNFYSAIGSYIDPPFYKDIYKSTNDCTWVPMDTSGLNGVDEFNTMATSPNGYLYLAASNGGLYRSRQAYVSAPDTPPAEHIGIAIFPNPASDYIDIRYDNVILLC